MVLNFCYVESLYRMFANVEIFTKYFWRDCLRHVNNIVVYRTWFSYIVVCCSTWKCIAQLKAAFKPFTLVLFNAYEFFCGTICMIYSICTHYIVSKHLGKLKHVYHKCNRSKLPLIESNSDTLLNPNLWVFPVNEW